MGDTLRSNRFGENPASDAGAELPGLGMGIHPCERADKQASCRATQRKLVVARDRPEPDRSGASGSTHGRKRPLRSPRASADPRGSRCRLGDWVTINPSARRKTGSLPPPT